MGLFNAANQWRQAILFLPGLLTSVVLPMLSSLQGPAEAHNYQKVLKVNLVLSILSSVTLALPCALLATWIMASYGADFLSGGNVLVLLCIVSVIIAVLSVVGQTIASDGKMWFGFALNSVWAIIMLGSCWLLRKRGATGLAFANLAAYGFHVITVSAYVYCRRHSIYRKKPMTSSLR
jgi:O-antigen/teichoic acid export membrane protein